MTVGRNEKREEEKGIKRKYGERVGEVKKERERKKRG